MCISLRRQRLRIRKGGWKEVHNITKKFLGFFLERVNGLKGDSKIIIKSLSTHHHADGKPEEVLQITKHYWSSSKQGT